MDLPTVRLGAARHAAGTGERARPCRWAIGSRDVCRFVRQNSGVGFLGRGGETLVRLSTQGLCRFGIWSQVPVMDLVMELGGPSRRGFMGVGTDKNLEKLWEP